MNHGSHWSPEDGPTFITGDHRRQQPLSLLVGVPVWTGGSAMRRAEQTHQEPAWTPRAWPWPWPWSGRQQHRRPRVGGLRHGDSKGHRCTCPHTDKTWTKRPSTPAFGVAAAS